MQIAGELGSIRSVSSFEIDGLTEVPSVDPMIWTFESCAD